MATHLIQKQILQLQLHQQAQAWEQQETVLARLQTEGLEVMEEVFNQIAGADRMLRIDHLELDLGSLPLHASSAIWKERFKTALLQAIQQVQIANGASASGASALSPDATDWEAWLFFLQHGQLPWYFAPPQFSAWEFSLLGFLQAAPTFRAAELLRLLRNHPAGLFRFFHQHSTAFQTALLKSVHPTLSALLEPWQKQFQDLAPIAWSQWLIHAWNGAVQRSVEALVDRLSQIKAELAVKAITPLDFSPSEMSALLLFEDVDRPHLPQRALLNPPEYNSDQPSASATAGLYIENAGLVIIAPFLPTFFEQLNLVSAGRFISPEATDRATQLLHFLVFGHDEAPEYELALAKVLCGLPESYPLHKNVPLTADECTEADALLKAIISHWNALGACSPHSLQAMFLQREGKLTYNGNDYFLQVEPQTVDILLNRLPWGFGMIKLPWMQGFLHTEWIY